MKWIEDDGGRAAAGFKGTTGDCVARAVAIASGRPYAEVYAACAAIEGTYTKRGKRQARSARNGVHVTRPAFKGYNAVARVSSGHRLCGIGSGCKVPPDRRRTSERPARGLGLATLDGGGRRRDPRHTQSAARDRGGSSTCGRLANSGQAND